MTNEEAISVIENEIQIDVRLCTDEQVERFQQALYMAIDALRSQPTGDPLTLEQLREMEKAEPVWWEDAGLWCLAQTRSIITPSGQCYGADRLPGKFYAYPPAHIDREEWAPCAMCGEYNVIQFNAWETDKMHLGNPDCMGTSLFCPHCGRPLTEEAWDMLENRLRG